MVLYTHLVQLQRSLVVGVWWYAQRAVMVDRAPLRAFNMMQEIGMIAMAVYVLIAVAWFIYEWWRGTR